MKKLRTSLTARIFLITSALLIAACAITYATIAYLTPITYKSMLADELSQQGDTLIAQLERVVPDESTALLDQFVRRTGADVQLMDDAGNTLYDSTPPAAIAGSSFSAVDDGANVSEDDEIAYTTESAAYVQQEVPTENEVAVPPTTDVLVDTAIAQDSDVVVQSAEGGMYAFRFADGTGAQLTLFGGMRAVNEATEAMGRVLPFLAVVVLLISLAGSYFYAWYITRPIVSIAGIARRMAALDFDARWRGRRRDEIGDLGGSLNLLSDNLSGALNDLKRANDQLKDDIEREREIERQRMAFFSAASHELKTPITILKGQLGGMLARVGVYEDREKYLARALAVTGRMESLVKEILTINRIGSGGFALKLDPVDLSKLVLNQLALDQELIEQKELSISTSIMPDAVVMGDEALLSKVLGNVLVNAIMYSPQGARVRVTAQSGGFSVTNSDSSIPEESIAQLFTPFYRVEQSRNRKSGGSGLGLYLVRTILELHGATYAIKNTPEGVCFEATFTTDGGSAGI